MTRRYSTMTFDDIMIDYMTIDDGSSCDMIEARFSVMDTDMNRNRSVISSNTIS